MAKKSNPLLAQIEAKMAAQYLHDLEINQELDIIAFMLTLNEELHIGPGRAGRMLNAYLAHKLEIADAIEEDHGPDKHSGDKELLHTRATLAKRMREIFSPEDWEKCRNMLQLLKDF